jgi:nicotinate-nucleotide adenylyltransferase
MKLCVFQGTFNPIHNAHLRVADFVCQNCSFDRILFIPAYCPPHKEADLDFANDRLEMVRLAVEDNSKFDVSDIEFKRGGKSYTYLTIKELYDIYKPDGLINFIIGSDAFEKIESWYETEKLKKLVKFLVFIREDNFDVSRYDYLKQKGYNFEFQKLPYEDISSTELREKIKSGVNIENFVPQKVKEYIEKHGLYKS